MKKFLALTALCAAFGLLLPTGGCEKYVLPAMHLSSDTLTFRAAGGELPLTVSSNVLWYVDNISSDDWYHFSVEIEDLGCDLTVTADENTSVQNRKASVTIRTETIFRTLVLIQEGAEDDGDSSVTPAA